MQRDRLHIYVPSGEEPDLVEGDPCVVHFPVDETDAIHRGDFLWLDGDDLDATVRPASELCLHFGRPYTWRELQRRFAALFAGIACAPSPVGECEWIPVATAGVYRVPSDAGRAMPGSLVGMAISPDGTILRNQQVQLVAAEDRAIGRVRLLNPTRDARLAVRIDSQVMRRVSHEEAA
mgnify:CR=1 FL=1